MRIVFGVASGEDAEQRGRALGGTQGMLLLPSPAHLSNTIIGNRRRWQEERTVCEVGDWQGCIRTAVHRSRKGGGMPPPLDRPTPPLPMFEADSQNFASAPSVPRGFGLWPSVGEHRRTQGGGGGASQPNPLPPPSDPPSTPSNTSLGIGTGGGRITSAGSRMATQPSQAGPRPFGQHAFMTSSCCGANLWRRAREICTAAGCRLRGCATRPRRSTQEDAAVVPGGGKSKGLIALEPAARSVREGNDPGRTQTCL